MHCIRSKIENFVRTKYESKRWVMDGPIPDPATLSDGEDEEAVSNYSTLISLESWLLIG